MRRVSTTIIILLCFLSMFLVTSPQVSSTTGWQWETLPPLQYSAVGYAESYNGEIYHLGGDYVQVYSPGNNTWWVRGASSVSYRGGSAIIGDRIYFVQSWHDARYYNISTNTYHDVIDPIVDRIDVSVTALGEIIYVVGGWISGDPWTSITTVEAYSITNDTWWEVAPLNIGRESPAVVSYGGYIYVMGGKNFTDSPPYPLLKTVERYDPVANNWSFVNSTNFPAHAATVTSEHIVILSYESNIRRSEAYIPAMDNWFMGPDPTWDWRCRNSAMVTLNSDAYVVGGRWANDTPLDPFYRWDGLESQAPNIQITSPSNNDFVNMTLNVSGNASDNYGLQKVEISIDQINWILCNGTDSWYANITLNAGLNTIYARATDEFNNTEIDSIDVIFDVTPPISSVDQYPHWINDTTAMFNATANDTGGSGVSNVSLWYSHRFFGQSFYTNWIRFGTDSLAPWSWNFTFRRGDGYYRFYSIATDNMNNTEAAPSSPDYNCTYDITSPVITLNSPTNNSFIQPGTIIDFSVTDSSPFTVDVFIIGDPGAFVPGLVQDMQPPYEIDTTNWPDSEYHIGVQATDDVGNIANKSFIFTIDSTSPTITSTNPANASTNASVTAPIVLQFNESVSPYSVELAISPFPVNTTIEYNWGTDNSTLSLSFSRNLSPNTEYTVTVTSARDLAGNNMTSNYTFSFRTWVDTDRDGIPDTVDPDDDGDGTADEWDAFPLDPWEAEDFDGDGVGNVADPDDDNDGVLDVDDLNPNDPNIGRPVRTNWALYLVIALIIIVVMAILLTVLLRPKHPDIMTPEEELLLEDQQMTIEEQEKEKEVTEVVEEEEEVTEVYE